MVLLPDLNEKISGKSDYKLLSSLTYGIDFENGVVLGMIDEIEALKQAIFLALSTKRFEHVIYSWSYGTELINSKIDNYQLLKSEMKRQIIETLKYDERIKKIDKFEFFQKERDSISVSFEVYSIFGNFSYVMEG